MTDSEFKRLSKIAPHKAWAEFKEMKQDIKELTKLLIAVREDLVARADMKGEKYVGLSSSLWIGLCDLQLKETTQ